MGDSSRFRIAEPQTPGSDDEEPPQADKRATSPAFVGDAMRALFETAEVSIRRGDETRVITKNEQALQQRPPGPLPTMTPQSPEELPRGLKPAPHVDLVLWLVLAAGLFGIIGWMLAHSP